MDKNSELKSKTEGIMENLDPLAHLKNLDYPRRAGTDGERKAAAYITDVLEGRGFAPLVQEFKFEKPKLLPKLIPPLVLLIWTTLSLVNLRVWNNSLVISILLLFLPLALILAILNLDALMRVSIKRRMKRLAKIEKNIEIGKLRSEKVITSRNVIAETGQEDADTQVLFTAHFDSISSKIPMGVMKITMILGAVGFLLYSLLYLTNTITSRFYNLDFMQLYFPYFALLASVFVVALLIAFISRLFRGNDSHGIIDDGTGTAILLELANFLKDQDIPNTRFTFGFFGAEEAGLVGSTYYYLNREVNQDRLRVFSVDMIGEVPPLAYVKHIYPVRKLNMDADFNQNLASVAEALEIKIEGKPFPYPGSDFGAFLIDGGCQTNWLINKSKLIHSKKDNYDNLNQDLVVDALKLLVGLFLVSK
jgi:hypothetical protein